MLTELPRYYFEVVVLYYIVNKIFVKKRDKNYLFFVLLVLAGILYYYTIKHTPIEFTYSYIIMSLYVYIVFNFYYEIETARFAFIIMFILVFKGIINFTNFSIRLFAINNNFKTLLGIVTNNYFRVYVKKLIYFAGMILFAGVYRNYNTKTNKFYILILLALATNVFIFHFNLKRYFALIEDTNYIFMLWAIMLNILFSSVFIVIMSTNAIKYHSEEEKIELEIKRYKSQVDYYKQLEEINNKIRAQRHDFINQIVVIEELINEECIEDAKKYLKDIVNYTNEINEVIDIKHRILSALINQKKRIMEKEKILFKHMINVPQKIHVDDIDLTGIMGNALDNAVEACSEVESKKITLYMNYEMGRLKIVIKNKFSGNLKRKAGKIVSSKGTGDERGVGLLSIEQIVKKYDGFVNVRTKDNVFILEILL